MRGRVFCFLGRNNFSLGRKHSFSGKEIVFLRDVFGMRSGWACFGRARKKDSFCLSKGLVLPFKRTRFGLQKDSF